MLDKSIFQKMTATCFAGSLRLALLFFFVGVLQMGSSQTEDFVMPGIYRVTAPVVEAVDSVAPIETKEGPKKSTAVREDLHRFMGFEVLPARYISLPYDTYQNVNVPGLLTDVGFLLLMLLPIVFLFSEKKQAPGLLALQNLSMILLCVLLLIISISGGYMHMHNSSTVPEALALLDSEPTAGTLGGWSDSINRTALSLYAPIHSVFTAMSDASNAVTYPILFCVFLALIALVGLRLKGSSKATKSIFYFMTFYFFMWWILGAGATWYGMLLFSVPFIFLLKGMGNPQAGFHKPASLFGKTGVLALMCSVWLLCIFAYRASNFNPSTAVWAENIYIYPFVEHQAGNMKEAEVWEKIYEGSVKLEKEVNKNEKGLVYRIGTAMNYFIKKNDKRVYTDTFLGLFEQMVQRFRDKEKIIEVLKSQGFEFILVDLNLPGIDKTPEKSLTRKFSNLMNTLYNNPMVEMVVTDRRIRIKDSGELVEEVFPVRGKIEKGGKFALFRIK